MRIKLWLVLCAALCVVACGTEVSLTQQPAPVVERSKPAETVRPTTPVTEPVVTRDVPTVQAAVSTEAKVSVIYFDFDSYVVKPEYQNVLEAQAKSLMANRKTKVLLGGHTDDLGGREYNLALGQKRADAVRRALAILGVSEAQMEAVSFGKEKPAQSGTDELARAKNRRVEIGAP